MEKLTENATIKTITYCLDSDIYAGFMIDITDNGATYEIYLYHKNYGVKSLMYGLMCNDIEYDDLIDNVSRNVADYIPGYINDYIDN